MTKIWILPLLLAINSLNAQSPADTIRPGDLQMKYLPAGKQSYLVYIVTKDGRKKSIWLWERSSKKEQWNGKDAVVIRQQWTTSDTGFNSRELISVNDPVDFTPRFHWVSNPRTGKEAYHFNKGLITGADTVKDNTRAGFTLSTDQPSFNWELDLETFPLLPLQKGKSYVINFYHPGGSAKPDWYTYTVTGMETLTTLNGKSVECYMLYTDYGKNRGNSTWWLSKDTHEVIKMEEHFGPITRYKIRLGVLE